MSRLWTGRFLYGFALVFALGLGAAPALAQERATEWPAVTAAATPDASGGAADATSAFGLPPSFGDLFKPLPGDFRRMVAPEQALVAGIGGLGAVIGHAWDNRVAGSHWGDGPMHSALAPGKLVGNFLVQAGGALATYSVGRATGSHRVATVGAALFRAQVVAQGTTQAIKFATQRTRPDGTSHSFPSGHSAAAFATATVLQSELGWKAAIPAYAAATWVATSRVQMERHYVSDVIAGATVGILAGRSVTIGRGSARFSVQPMPVAGGAGISFTKVAR